MAKKKSKPDLTEGGDKALDIALAAIEKQFGKGSVMRMSAEDCYEDVECWGTGILGIDLEAGKAIPKGRIIEIFGPESSGKTTLTLHIASNVQQQGGKVAFVDAEHALDVTYATKLGVDVPSMIISQPDCGEQALEITDMLVRSGAVDLLIVDSVAALTPRAELEGDMGDSHMGLQARLMSQALRKLTGSISRSNCTVIFINQLRMKIGVMFGNPETTTGGNALKFYASQRYDVRPAGWIKDGEQIIGAKSKVKIIKNKVAPPFGTVELDVDFGYGFSKTSDLLNLGLKYEIINKAGAWISYNGSNIGQGSEKAKQYLAENPDVYNEIKEKIIRAKSGLPPENVDEETGEIIDV